MPQDLRPRHIAPFIKATMEFAPIVLIQGPRQCGKTTLAQMLGQAEDYQYISFDDSEVQNTATLNPSQFINSLPERVILDEIQKAPQLFSLIKMAVDRNQKPGNFILTGSANVLQLSQISDSLAGRMDIFRLHPFSQSEFEQSAPQFINSIFSPSFQIELNAHLQSQDILDRIVIGGYPRAIQRTGHINTRWYKNYINSIIQRDVPDISKIRSPQILVQLLTAVAAQTGSLLSVNSLSKSFQLSRFAIDDYLSLLEKVFLLERLPPWHRNQLKRLIKTPKLHIADSGIACALLNLNTPELESNHSLLGGILETFVIQELRRQASALAQPHNFFHYRHKDGAEVDIVIERGPTELIGVEVKASTSVNRADFKGLRKLKTDAGDHFVRGLLVYTGTRRLSFGDNLYAIPISDLWAG